MQQQSGLLKFGVKAAEIFMKDHAPIKSDQLANLTKFDHNVLIDW
jgi:hypothetical protein